MPTPGVLHAGARRFILPALLITALFYALFTRQAPRAAWVFNGLTMGTTYTVKVIPKAGADADARRRAAEAIRGALEAVNARMSTYQPDSELSRLNRAAAGRHPASSALLSLLEDARRISEASGGAFDVTVGPLVNAWGFGPDKAGSAPTEAEVEALRARVGYDKLQIHASTGELERGRGDLYVDLSAIAKGYGVDQVAEALIGLGYTDFMVEVGGEVRAGGRNAEGVPWQIGVQRPALDGEAGVEEIVSLTEMALATSGDYRNYREIDGLRVSHTIDARLGRPITHNLASVSVLHPRCALADGWATALNVLGPEEGFKLATREGLAALFITREGERFQQRATAAFEAHRFNPAARRER
ncbi:FAD:protein FMN transferase [Myxococcota bacterium]|nr:FAD:protein FMN transferase [Myxococcota bacterium]MBU1430805.1 FAD:protein FMN transferase [Myxococcota bacterium]MBU1900111.1 FAD:protein FMN transferase [Myxococcota bacterium]